MGFETTVCHIDYNEIEGIYGYLYILDKRI